MVNVKCCACGVLVRGKKNRVGGDHFWKDFERWMREKHPEKDLFKKQDDICEKCHSKVKTKLKLCYCFYRSVSN